MRRLLPAFLILLAGVAAPRASVAQADRLCFDQPGVVHCIEGRFREFWEQNGGLPVFGYPMTAPANEVNADTGREHLTQWFERVRFELHPENPAPYDVLLGRIGDERLRQMNVVWHTRDREPGPRPGCIWFEQTGHNVCNLDVGPDFLRYWQSHGLQDPRLDTFGRSLALFGMPISGIETETTEATGTILTQWFERGRFEWHVQGPTQGQVLLGLLGNEVREGRGEQVPPVGAP